MILVSTHEQRMLLLRMLLSSLITLGGGILLIITIVYGISLQDKADCMKWADEAILYPGFYITSDQKNQCDYLGMQVNAPVIQTDHSEDKPQIP